MAKSAFANRLAILRNGRELTQEEFATKFSDYMNAKTRLSELTISAWENDTRTPSLRLFKGLCDFFSVSADYLLGLTDDMSNEDNTSVMDEPQKHTHDLKLKKSDLSKYDGEPVFVVYKDKQFSNEWGIIDAAQNRIILKNRLLKIGVLKCDYYVSIPIEEKRADYTRNKPYSINQLANANKVWVTMLSAEGYIRGKYDGWYQNMKSDNNEGYLIKKNGLTLPYEGLNVSYMAYPSEMS